MNTKFYRQKIIKYNKKYNILINQNGGFYLSDIRPRKDAKKLGGLYKDSLLTNLQNHLKKNQNIFDKVFKRDIDANLENLKQIILQMETEDYMKIYDYFISIYKNNEIYTQIFKDKNNKIFFEYENMEQSHINFGALVFISFLIELELFSLVHSVIPYNTTDKLSQNLLPSVFREDCSNICTITRIYKLNIENKSVIEIAQIFAHELDKLFELFMSTLVSNLQKSLDLSSDEIINNIMPLEHFDRAQYNDNNMIKFDYIFGNWIDNLVKKIKEKYDKDNEIMTNSINILKQKRNLLLETSNDNDEINKLELDIAEEIAKFDMKWGFFSEEKFVSIINKEIYTSLNNIENDSAKYIAEGTGFFSFIFLDFPEKIDPLKTHRPFFGSCITYSLFEMYIMVRLHIKSEKVNLCLESEYEIPHFYWYNTTNVLGLSTLSHWCTSHFMKYVDESNDYSINEKEYKFRSMSDIYIDEKKYDTIACFSLKNDKDKIFNAIIYPIYDSYIQYIIGIESEEMRNIIEYFIENRIKYIKKYISTDIKYNFKISRNNDVEQFKNLIKNNIIGIFINLLKIRTLCISVHCRKNISDTNPQKSDIIYREFIELESGIYGFEYGNYLICTEMKKNEK